MPTAIIRGVELNYKVVGTSGPWVALMPGGRRGFPELIPLATLIAANGFRVLLHDRRNTGASQVVFDDSDAEDAIWADDLHLLLQHLGAGCAFVGGTSSGCRTAILLALRHRSAVQGLLLMRITGGAVAAARLPDAYYTQFIRTAQSGGMEAIASTEHWRARVTERPANRDVFETTPLDRFVSVMTAWRERFLSGANMTVQGISDDELRSIGVPTVIIPGNDRIHSSSSARHAQRMIPGAVLHELPVEDSDAEFIDYPAWRPYEPEIASAFVRLMKSALERPQS